MSTTSSSSAGGGDTEDVYITKAQLEGVIKAINIARGTALDAEKHVVDVGRQMSVAKWETRIFLESDIENYYIDYNP